MGCVFYAGFLALALLFMLFDGAASEGAREGLRLFSSGMLPCLFPFAVCGHYLISAAPVNGALPETKTGAALRGLGRAGLCAVCGTPSAALVCRRLRDSGLSLRSASALCAALNQTGPLFIISFLAGELFGAPRLWGLFALSHYLPSFAAALILTAFCPSEEAYPPLGKAVTPKPLMTFGMALSEASLAMVRVGGTVVFFRVLCSVLSESGLTALLPRGLAFASAGLLELTNGLALLSALGPGRLVCCVCCFILSFGGLCVFVQSKLFFEELLPLPYFAVKLAVSSTSFLLCYLFYPVMGGTAAAMSGLDESLMLTRTGELAAALLCVLLGVASSLLYARLAVRRACPE